MRACRRLNREAGKTFAHLHVPTSCRHCEHPHCMADCPPNAIHRGPDGEVYIDETCIGCGNCQRNCPYGVIRMDKVPPKKPSLLVWLLVRHRPRPRRAAARAGPRSRVSPETPKKAIKCDMCSGIEGGPACVRACPTGAAIRVAPEEFLTVARMGAGGLASVASRGIERTDLGDGTSHEGFLRHRNYRWLKIAAALCARRDPRLSADRRRAAAQRRQLVRLHAGHDRRAADPLADRCSASASGRSPAGAGR